MDGFVRFLFLLIGLAFIVVLAGCRSGRRCRAVTTWPSAQHNVNRTPSTGRADANQLPVVVQSRSPSIDVQHMRPGRCDQCGCRPGWPSLYVIYCSGCGRGKARTPSVVVDTEDSGGLRSGRVRWRHRYALVEYDELPPLWVQLRPWQWVLSSCGTQRTGTPHVRTQDGKSAVFRLR